MRAIAGAMRFPPALWFEDIPAQAVLRVDVLEQRLDNKTAAVDETLERKLDSMDRQRSNYSLAFNVALFVCGVLAGIVVTLVFG